MFKIYDGRKEFYQWDIDRKLIVEDDSINQVHFCNRTGNCSLICDVYDEDGTRVVNVPNIILQSNLRIYVYGYDKNYTKFEDEFNVKPRTKPDDYVYTETEVQNYANLKDELTEYVDAYFEHEDETLKAYIDEQLGVIENGAY